MKNMFPLLSATLMIALSNSTCLAQSKAVAKKYEVPLRTEPYTFRNYPIIRLNGTTYRINTPGISIKLTSKDTADVYEVVFAIQSSDRNPYSYTVNPHKALPQNAFRIVPMGGYGIGEQVIHVFITCKKLPPNGSILKEYPGAILVSISKNGESNTLLLPVSIVSNP